MWQLPQPTDDGDKREGRNGDTEEEVWGRRRWGGGGRDREGGWKGKWDGKGSEAGCKDKDGSKLGLEGEEAGGGSGGVSKGPKSMEGTQTAKYGLGADAGLVSVNLG